MLAKPINSAIKNHFQSLFNKATEEAANDFSFNIKAKLENLDHFNQLKLLIGESEKLDEIIENSEYPFYVDNHSSEDWLLNQFASRTFLLNIDESIQLVESIRLGKYRALIINAKFQLKDGIPLYSFAAFMQGKIDPYFANFEYAYNISEEDYYKIRTWQSEKLIKIVCFESGIFIKQIQGHCKSLADPLDFLLNEKKKIDSCLEKAIPDSKELKSILSELFVLRDFNTNIFDDSILVECSKICTTDQLNFKFIFPTFINPIIYKVDQKVYRNFTNEVSIFFSINNVAHWIDDVQKGQPFDQPVKETNWTGLFQKIKNDAAKEVKILIKEIDTYLAKTKISDDQIKKYLSDKLDIYRHKFNNHKKKYYFGLLKEEQDDLLRKMFITNSFFGHDIVDQINSIRDAIVIYEMSWEIVGIHGAIFNSRRMNPSDNGGSYSEISYLMYQMVLDKELYHESHKCIDDFFEHFRSYFLPLEIHFDNIRDVMAKLFGKSLGHLQSVLDDSEPTNKVLFLQSRLKQLKQRELEFKQFEYQDPFDQKELEYTHLFKDFLEIEADFIREIKDLHILPSLPVKIVAETLSQPVFLLPADISSDDTLKSVKSIPLAFDYKQNATNTDAIVNLLVNLKKNKFVAQDTDIKNFRKIFNNTKPEKPIVWSGNISELAYFVKIIHNEFKLITDLKKDIWKVTAMLFIDEKGNQFPFAKFRGQKTPAKAEFLENAANLLK
jgi:hypothetical protein